jgi:hypothetical protein
MCGRGGDLSVPVLLMVKPARGFRPDESKQPNEKTSMKTRTNGKPAA